MKGKKAASSLVEREEPGPRAEGAPRIACGGREAKPPSLAVVKIWRRSHYCWYDARGQNCYSSTIIVVVVASTIL